MWSFENKADNSSRTRKLSYQKYSCDVGMYHGNFRNYSIKIGNDKKFECLPNNAMWIPLAFLIMTTANGKHRHFLEAIRRFSKFPVFPIFYGRLMAFAEVNKTHVTFTTMYSRVSISRTRISRILRNSKRLSALKIHFDCFLQP